MRGEYRDTNLGPIRLDIVKVKYTIAKEYDPREPCVDVAILDTALHPEKTRKKQTPVTKAFHSETELQRMFLKTLSRIEDLEKAGCCCTL